MHSPTRSVRSLRGQPHPLLAAQENAWLLAMVSFALVHFAMASPVFSFVCLAVTGGAMHGLDTEWMKLQSVSLASQPHLTSGYPLFSVVLAWSAWAQDWLPSHTWLFLVGVSMTALASRWRTPNEQREVSTARSALHPQNHDQVDYTTPRGSPHRYQLCPYRAGLGGCSYTVVHAPTLPTTTTSTTTLMSTTTTPTGTNSAHTALVWAGVVRAPTLLTTTMSWAAPKYQSEHFLLKII